MEKVVHTPSRQQKSWNFLATVFYVVCLIGLGFLLKRKGLGPDDFKFRDIVLMVLGTYRLTRLLVFDTIFKLLRDFVKARSNYLVFYVVREIITCPWCAGVWASLIIVIIYFLVPFGQILVILFAISGVASFIVIIVNLFGLSTEEKQYRVKELKQESDYSSPHHEP